MSMIRLAARLLANYWNCPSQLAAQYRRRMSERKAIGDFLRAKSYRHRFIRPDDFGGWVVSVHIGDEWRTYFLHHNVNGVGGVSYSTAK